MGERRRRTKHAKSFKDRLLEEAAKFREAAERLPPGTERELLMRRVDQAERAAEITDWLAKPASAPLEPTLANLLKPT